MEEQLLEWVVIIKYYGILAPLIFISFHLVRQFFFIPVHLICLLGGLLFGSLFGSLYSIIGLTLNSLLFYFATALLPKSVQKLKLLKQRWFGYQTFTISQISVLRLFPFIHFQIFNLFLLEKSNRFFSYMKMAFFSNIPLAICYTIFGNLIRDLSWNYIVLFAVSILIISFLLREKKEIIPWKHFFQKTSI